MITEYDSALGQIAFLVRPPSRCPGRLQDGSHCVRGALEQRCAGQYQLLRLGSCARPDSREAIARVRTPNCHKGKLRSGIDLIHASYLVVPLTFVILRDALYIQVNESSKI
jgi:hypothetical protein